MELGDVLEGAARISPRRVVRALVLLGLVVYLAVPSVREPVVAWWVSYKADQLTSRVETSSASRCDAYPPTGLSLPS